MIMTSTKVDESMVSSLCVNASDYSEWESYVGRWEGGSGTQWESECVCVRGIGGEREREREKIHQLTLKQLSTIKTAQEASRPASAVEINCHRILIHSNTIVLQMENTEHIISMDPEPVAS